MSDQKPSYRHTHPALEPRAVIAVALAARGVGGDTVSLADALIETLQRSGYSFMQKVCEACADEAEWGP